MGRFSRQFGDVYQHIRADIFKLCTYINFTPTAQQARLLWAVMMAHTGRAPLRIAVKSGQGPGKTTISCIIALWRSLQAENAMTILTAPTMRQCRDVWLAEFRRLHSRFPKELQAFVTVTMTKVYIGDPTKYPDWGVKTVTATDDKNAQGFHEKNMTIICEEASGIPRSMIEQYKGTASNPNCLFLMIGNPNLRDCAFFDCFNSQAHEWQTLTFNAEETPKSEWFDPIRNKQIADEYGEDSDVYRVRVKGEFPHSDPNSVMSSEDISACMDKRLMSVCAKMSGVRQFGIDLARFGGDESVVYRRSGNALVEWAKYNHTEPMIVLDNAVRMQTNVLWPNEGTRFVVDCGGLGGGSVYRLHEAGKEVHEFYFNGKSTRPRQYKDKITQAYFEMAKNLKARHRYLPRDNILLQQLSSRLYYMNRQGQIVLESKDEYMKRGNESPDRGDAAVLASWDGAIADGHLSTQLGPSMAGAA